MKRFKKRYNVFKNRYSRKKIRFMLCLNILLCLFLLIFFVGYAEINEELLIEGEAVFRGDEDIRITDLKYISSENGGMEYYNSQYGKTGVITGIALQNINSKITYEVTITNSSNMKMSIDKILKANFNNENIEYELIGVSEKDIVSEKSEKKFKILFKYKQNVSTVPENKVLESRIEFVFIEKDMIPPVLTEVAGVPKIYYISQSESIALHNYVVALDNVEGDITGKINISSSPEFNKNIPGTYDVTYNVQDESGNNAIPVNIKIVIWNFIKIDSGRYHALALTSHGRVWAWGYNADGQIGKGSSGNAEVPIELNLRNVIDIAANGLSSYAVMDTGKIYSWGSGTEGKLGDGSTASRNAPGLVSTPDGVKFVKINAQVSSVVALTDTGEVYTWGANEVGQLGDGTATTKNIPTKIGLSDIIEVSQGGMAGAAIDKNGNLYTWGSDTTYDMLGNAEDSGPRNVPGTYSGLTNMKFVQACNYHMIGIDNTGQVYTWGEGSNGKLGNGVTTNSKTPYKTVITNGEKASGHWYHSLIKTIDGKLYVFGQNSYGKLGLGDTTTRTSPVHNNNSVFLSNGIGNVLAVSAMLDSSVVLTQDSITNISTVYGMGYNGSYQYGNGSITSSSVPTRWEFTPPNPE